MINRENFFDIQRYRTYYLQNIKRNSASTLRRRRAQTRHLLEWAGETPFPEAHTIQPTFTTYLTSARNDGSDKPLAVSTRRATCGVARRFFRWAKHEYPRRYKTVKRNWIETIRVHERNTSTNNNRELYTLSEVKRLISLPTETLTEQRDQAAIAFLFLSGARSGAFVSLPICAIDLKNLSVHQLPELGVQTKLQKAAVTYLLDIPDLLEVIHQWDKLVRQQLSPDALWYAMVTRDGTGFAGTKRPGKRRAKAIANGLRELCERANITYYPPHSLRHSHVVYALQRARNMADLKAISQNVMHEDITITNQIYGGLPNETVKAKIAGLTRSTSPEALVDMEALADAIVERLGSSTSLDRVLGDSNVEKTEGAFQ